MTFAEVLTILGWVSFAGGAAAGIVAHNADRRLQAFRVAGKPESSYLLVPIRIRRELYRPEAHHLVDRAWHAIIAMYGLGLTAIILLSLGGMAK